METIKDIDIDSMSQEELERFINSQGQATEETSTQAPGEESEEDANQNASEIDTEKEIQEETEEDPQSGQTEEEDIPEFYRGKSAKELIKIIEDNKRYESRRGNEMHQLKTQLAELQGTINRKFDSSPEMTKSQKKDYIDDLIESKGYSKEDVEVISKIVQHETKRVLQDKEREETERLEQQRNSAANDNQQLWDQIKEYIPNFESVETEMIQKIRENPEKTLYKPGWVSSYVKQIKSGSSFEEKKVFEDRPDVKKRIGRTVTAKTTSRISQGAISKSDLESKDPETFRRAWNHFNPNAKI